MQLLFSIYDENIDSILTIEDDHPFEFHLFCKVKYKVSLHAKKTFD